MITFTAIALCLPTLIPASLATVAPAAFTTEVPATEVRRQATERDFKATRDAGKVLLERTYDQTLDRNRDKNAWIVLSASDPKIEFRLGESTTCALRITDSKFAGKGIEVFTIVRFQDRTPTYSILAPDRGAYDRTYDQVAIDKEKYFLVDRAQAGRANMNASTPSAQTVLGGPTWSVHDGRVQIQILMIAKERASVAPPAPGDGAQARSGDGNKTTERISTSREEQGRRALDAADAQRRNTQDALKKLEEGLRRITDGPGVHACDKGRVKCTGCDGTGIINHLPCIGCAGRGWSQCTPCFIRGV